MLSVKTEEHFRIIQIAGTFDRLVHTVKYGLIQLYFVYF